MHIIQCTCRYNERCTSMVCARSVLLGNYKLYYFIVQLSPSLYIFRDPLHNEQINTQCEFRISKSWRIAYWQLALWPYTARVPASLLGQDVSHSSFVNICRPNCSLIYDVVWQQLELYSLLLLHSSATRAHSDEKIAQ